VGSAPREGPSGTVTGGWEHLDVRVDLPDWSRKQLEDTALAHGGELALLYGREPGEASIERLVVNMLRHEFTDYDVDPSLEAKRRSCVAIAERFPWLAEEGCRQIDQRKRQEAEAAMWSEMADFLQRERAQKAAERSRAFREAISLMPAGTKVMARVAGREREGTIVWQGRARVDVAYTIKSGQERTKRLYASDVRVAEPQRR
jgi:hypothetical protein